MVTIDMEKCTGCLKCAKVCPFKVIGTENGKPETADDKLCIKCLHCAAACPQNAISLGSLDGILPDEMPKLPDNLKDLIEGHLMTRRSYRRFKPEPVPADIISGALRVAAWAPSAKNQHPARWIVIRDEDRISEMMKFILDYVKETGASPEVAELYGLGHNVVTGTAKALILGYAKTDAVNPPVDTALALYNAELVLQSQGIGTCWAGYLVRFCNLIPAIRKMLALPENCHVYGALMAGYPENERYIHIPNRHKQPDVRWL
jgi:nitroreductase/NAD-dependent dihydropyrimidine dehydrogenase PreA subunit